MSAVIYAAIVVMWAVVLVPMWLRRHDAATESRSVDKFSTAMRTLSRRTHGTPGRRYVVMPRRTAGTVSVHVTGAAVASRSSSRPVRPAPSAARAAMVRRRRRTTIILAATVTLTALLAVVGVFPWLVQVFLDLVLVAFLAHLRTQARRAAAVTRRRRQVPVPAAATRPSATPRPAVPARTAAVAATVEPVVAASVDVTWTEELRAGAAFDVEVESDGSWQPVPVPPPTYTLKPPAPSPAAAAYDSETTEEMQPVVADEVPTELDEILERRWAVND